jgi:hypothetical protein
MGVSGMTEEPKPQKKKVRKLGGKSLTEEPKPQEKKVRKPEGKSRWDNIKGFFLENPTFALTLSYLYVTAVGMLYSAVLYGRFGINIFDYSEIADFVLAAFKNPIALVVTGFQVALLYIMGYVNAWLTLRRNIRSHQRESGYMVRVRSPALTMLKTTVVRLQFGAFILLGVTFLGATCLLAILTASSIKNGNKPTVEVRYRSFSGTAGQMTTPGLAFIGATQRAAFFYDEADKRTIVIPQAQIVSIEVPD